MTSPADSSVQNLLPVQAYFDVQGNFQTFIGQGKPFYATPDPNQSGLHITNSTIDSTTIGATTPSTGVFTNIATTTGTISTAATGPTDIVNKQYVDYYAAGLSWKEPVITATDSNITLSGTQTITGVTVVVGDTVLVKNQTNAAENGIYVVSSGAWTRSVGADTWNEYVGAIVFVVEGALLGSAWYCTAQPGGTLGVTAINWSNFSVASSYTAGTGLQLIGTQFSIANTTVTTGSYGTASKTASFTVNQQGQLTAASQQDIAIAYTQVSGLGTMAVQNANSVNITGGSISGITDLAVADGGTGASTASGARANLGAAASGANSDITSLSGITGAISTPNYIAFNTSYATALSAGQLGWDGNNTLGLGMAGGNVTQHIGEDQFFYYKASGTVTKGQVVMFTGAVGASGVPTGAPATGVTDGTYIMGIAAEDVAANAFGLVQAFGTLRNVNTTGYADGDILWYDPAVTGGLTKTKPSAPNVKVQMAAVINGGSSGGGTILIRINPGSVLGGTDSNVQFGTLSTNDLIQYNGSYWLNIAPSALTGVGSVANAVTFNNGGTGDASGTTFNGSSAKTVSYNTVGAPSTTGTNASGTWGISISGNAATATTSTNLAGGANGSIPYQTGSGATSMLAIGTNGYVLTSNGTTFGWSALPASGITITDDTSTASARYVTFTSATSGSITGENVSSTKLTYTPSTGTLAATVFSGSGASLTNVVNSITGTSNQVTASASTGAVTLSLPQSIATTSSVQFGSFGVGTAASGTSGEIRATNNVTAYYSSDRQFKENIIPIENALDKVKSIGGKYFDWTDSYIESKGGIDGYFVQKSDFGVIAQDVQSVFPKAVRTREDGTLAVDYEKLVALAFQAIVELNVQIEQLKYFKTGA